MTTDVRLDMDWCTDLLVDLLRIPSPTGRTDEVVQFIGELLEDQLDLEPRLTRRGSIQAALPGGGEGPGRRGVVVHADTIGAMVRFIREDGWLEVAPVGTWSARFAEGARVTVFVDHGTPITGTILPRKASGHAYGDEVDEQPVNGDQVVVRPDVLVHSREEIEELGVHVGDHVAVHALPFVTPTGFVNSRHLDDKAGIAALLTAVKGLREAGIDDVGTGRGQRSADRHRPAGVGTGVRPPGGRVRQHRVAPGKERPGGIARRHHHGVEVFPGLYRHRLEALRRGAASGSAAR